ncbi:hypothetical protein K432DRAFT_403678 [Lepidopterella palustris CBS 459.81]|uniref:Uncharacterized protein n=1 Tax=Lepidopterella palustris CBS 459.81 TaxID=1314670 RepID=A0A8E2JGE9_9PEZI|nr:hypothetical protein K432DRAFT_403678 [Lepidopterella palustris CBS 459.81]
MSKSSGQQTTSLQVIGAGLPRTSTSSLQTALHTIGFAPCYHTITDFLPRARRHGPLWLAAMRASSKAERQKILAKIVKGYTAIVVLSVRTSPEAWLDSVSSSIAAVFGKQFAYYLACFVPELHFGFLMNNLWDAQTLAKHNIGVRTTEYYIKHNEHIRTLVPAARLLESNAADGWGPLCEFLGSEKPEGVAFPRRNDRKAARGLIASLVVYGVGIWVAVGVCAWVAVWGGRSLVGMGA